MIYGLFIILVTGFISFVVIDLYKNSLKSEGVSFLKKLFFYHLALAFTYYWYVQSNNSDSLRYFEKIIIHYRGPEWSDFYGTSTTFIEWVGYPFIQYFGFSYEAIMALFAFFGFLGFIFFYLFFREAQKTRIEFIGFDAIYLFFLLPNLHFWSSSFGKGAMVFLGIGMFFFALNQPVKRVVFLILGGVLIYHVRPHIMMVILVAILIGFTFSGKGLSWGVRLVILTVAILALYYIYDDVLKVVGIEEEELLTQGFNLTDRAFDLTKADSGIDISSYSLPLQLFTFLYRPLFFDAPGFLGLVVSIENIFLLFITIYFFLKGGAKYLLTANFIVKTAFVSFFTVSLALAQIAGNLGLAIRQKSQVMLLFLFVILRYLDEKKLLELRKNWIRTKKLKLRKNQYPVN